MALTGVLRPGHAQLRVLDLEESIEFYSNVLGLIQTGRDGDRAYFKAWDERDHHSLILRGAGEATPFVLWVLSGDVHKQWDWNRGEAKGNGFDVKALRTIIRMRKQDADERQEQETILETYMHALGMI